MSATGRNKKGKARRKSDFYETPEHTAWVALQFIDWNNVKVAYEPCAGKNRIINLAKSYAPHVQWDWAEINKGRDALRYIPRYPPDLILTNPPYSIAPQVIDAVQRLSLCTIMLLRLDFLGTQARHPWWNGPIELMPNRLPTHIKVCSVRPKFAWNSSDTCEYAWFCWDYSGRIVTGPTIEVLRMKKEVLARKPLRVRLK